MGLTRHTPDRTISFIGSAYSKTMGPIKIFIKTWRSQRRFFVLLINKPITTLSFLKSGEASNWGNGKREEQTNCPITVDLPIGNKDCKGNAFDNEHPEVVFVHIACCCLGFTEKSTRFVGRVFHFKSKEKRIHKQHPCGEGNQCDKGIFDNQKSNQQEQQPHHSTNGLQWMESLTILKSFDKPCRNPAATLFLVCVFRHLTSLKNLISSNYILTFLEPTTK